MSSLILNLNEIPEEGRSFLFDRKSGELNETLSEIIKNRDYVVSLRLTPIGNAYELIGHFKTQMDLTCSRCAWDFVHSIDEKFHEIIVVQDELPRNGHQARPNHSSEFVQGGPFFNEIRSTQFDLGEFLREIIALAEPIAPTGYPDCDDSCANFQMALKEGWISQNEEKKSSPFAVLEKLKQ